MNSRRAALPRSSHAQASGAGPLPEIEKSISRATIASCCRLSTRPRSRGGTPARSEQHEQLRQVRSRAHEHRPRRRRRGSCDAARSGCGRRARAGRPRTAVPHTRSPSSTAMCSTPAASMSTVASTASCPDGHRRRPAVRAIELTGASTTPAPSPSATHARRLGVGHDPEPLRRRAHEQRRVAARRRAARQRSRMRVVGRAERRRAHDRRHRRRADVEQPVHGVPGARQALAHRPRDVRRARLACRARRRDACGASSAQRRRLARADRERRRHPRQQRRVAEALAGLEHLRPARPRGRAPSSRSGPPTARWPERRPRPARPRPPPARPRSASAATAAISAGSRPSNGG